MISGREATMTPCPAPDQLLSFTSGELAEDRAAIIEQHIDSCGECRAVLSNLARGGPPPSFGRYRIDTVLGSGGMGIVYRAYDPQLARPLAIKVVRRAGDDTQGRARLVREAQALARLSHPHVCHVYDVGTEGEEVWLAMELIDGVQLRQWAGERHNRDEILDVLLGAAEGIAAAHNAGLVHRDIKPENVLVTRDNRAIVTDFGLARHEDAVDPNASTVSTDPHLTATGAIAGTPAYLAPEQLLGDPIDARVDQFAWAVMAWELLTGSRPFPIVFAVRVEAIRAGVKVPPDLPKHLAQPLMRAMAASPSDRYPSMRELIDALRKKPATASSSDRTEHKRGPSRTPILAAVGLLALGAGATAIAMWPNKDRKAVTSAQPQPIQPPAPTQAAQQPPAPAQTAQEPAPQQPAPQIATAQPPTPSPAPSPAPVAKTIARGKTSQGTTPPPPPPTHTPAVSVDLPPSSDADRDSAGHKYCRSCNIATADAFCFIPYDFDHPNTTMKHSVVDWGEVTKIDTEIGTLAEDRFKETIITMRGQRKTYRFKDELIVGRVVTKVGAKLAVCEEDESDFYQFTGGPTSRMQAVITLTAPPRITEAAKKKAQHIPDLRIAAASVRGELDRLEPDGVYLVYAQAGSIDGQEWRMDRYWLDVPPGTPGENKLAPKKFNWMIMKNPEIVERDGKNHVLMHAVEILDDLFP